MGLSVGKTNNKMVNEVSLKEKNYWPQSRNGPGVVCWEYGIASAPEKHHRHAQRID